MLYPRITRRSTAADPQPEGRTSSHQILPPKKQNTPWMLQAVRGGYFGVRLGNWPKNEAREYLRTCNIKTSMVEYIIESALSDKMNGVVNVEQVEPKFWKQIDCFGKFKFPNLPLHGLCHGIVPDVMSIIHQVFKKYRKMESFCQHSNPILDVVAGFGLDYMKVKLLPKAAWVGENSLAYSRLMTYLYGSYLLNDDLGGTEEAKVTKTFLRCMLNLFQALMSILMMRTAPSSEVINDHIKLFMSSAHYLHNHHGLLDTSEKSTVHPGEKANKPGKAQSVKKTFVHLQSKVALVAMLAELGEDTNGNIGDLRKRLGNVTVPRLKTKLKSLGGQSTKNKKKDDLFLLLRQTVVPDATDTTTTNQEDAGGTATKPKVEKMCWNKGNWLSFMANIARQIDYLGPLHLIW